METPTSHPELRRGLSNSFSGDVNLNHCNVNALRDLFTRQQGFLDYFFSNLEYDSVERFCQTCLDCTGVICFTGVGKSGFIAQKITQTLVSTGTKAVFLSPTDALHGDIGIIGQDDLLVCFSKSGGTDELLKLLPYAKAKGAKLVSVASVRGSKMEEMCDMSVILPLERELCPFDLAPVTSTAIQMLFGDTVAIALMLVGTSPRTQCCLLRDASKLRPPGRAAAKSPLPLSAPYLSTA
mmetsp:Transcript_27445/g.64996  ORF Transcript_27445/g.64996 Transcript_27445/m.64996 type:complete len:238 (+) Transcript_27445:178-891(+)